MGKYRFKKEARKINKAVRAVNKAIEEDSLWKGRFVFHEIKKQLCIYDDHSGCSMNVLIEAIDKKTGITSLEWISNYNARRKLFYFANNFIVKDVEVWGENPSPRDNNFVEDYTKKKIDYKTFKRIYKYTKEYEGLQNSRLTRRHF